MAAQQTSQSRLGVNIYRAFFGDMPPDQIFWPAARFADRALEADYQAHLVKNELSKERLINYLGLSVYVLFGVLDFITFKSNLTEVLMLRLLICFPAGLLLVVLTHVEALKKYFQVATAGLLLIASLSIVAMIGMMGPAGGPPYIIGILTVFIVYSCLQRLSFPAGAAIYLFVFATYSLTVTVLSPKTGTEIASGHFFMTTITLVALVTSYMQEVRSRLEFYRRRQREMDAAFIEKLLIEATAADRAKISFLSILSHELRTPLHQIVGFSEVVRNQIENEPKADPRPYLDEIHGSAARLLASIGKMLRYADATAGKISYDIDECSVQYLVETVIDQARIKSENAKVTINAEGLEQANLRIDHLHTAYAIGHLMDNAIAASKPGSTIYLSGEPGKDGYYVLTLKDQGCGMTKDQIEAAFKPFMQAEEARTRSQEGVGLGLSLARKMLEDQKGDLTLQSTPGVGTTAKLRLPLARKLEREEEASAA